MSCSRADRNFDGVRDCFDGLWGGAGETGLQMVGRGAEVSEQFVSFRGVHSYETCDEHLERCYLTFEGLYVAFWDRPDKMLQCESKEVESSSPTFVFLQLADRYILFLSFHNVDKAPYDYILSDTSQSQYEFI